MPKTNIKSVVDSIRVMLSSDPKVVQSILNDEVLAKAAAGLGAAPEIKDRWTEGELNAGAKKEEIKTGPQVMSSGDGAEKMVAHYSSPDAQHGTTMTAETLSRILGPLASSMKAHGEAISALIASQGRTNQVLASIFSKSEDEEDEEETEVVEINESKAKSFLKQAKRKLAKAEDEDDRKAAKLLKAEASKLFALARGHARLAGDLELDKSIRKAASEAGIKADINVVQEEEEDEEEETDKSNQEKVPESKAEGADDAAAKAAEAAKAAAAAKGLSPEMAAFMDRFEKIEKSLEGVGMLQMSVNQMLSTVSGQTKLINLPEFSKAAAPDALAIIKGKVDQYAESGAMQAADELAAGEILGQIEAVREGNLDGSVVLARIQKSTAVIQNLFADVTGAALKKAA